MRQAAFDALYSPQDAFISGVTPESRESSRSGAEAAARVRGRHLERLRVLWQEPRTMQDVAVLAGLPINSICSLKSALAADLEFAGYELIERADGRNTKRTKWRIRA